MPYQSYHKGAFTLQTRFYPSFDLSFELQAAFSLNLAGTPIIIVREVNRPSFIELSFLSGSA